MKFKTFIIFLALSALEVDSDCDFDVIVKINSLWRDNAATEVLEKLVGSMTYLYIPQVLEQEMTGLKCIKTVLDVTKTAEDYHLYEGDGKVLKYHMIESPLNITRSFDSYQTSADDYVFPVYLKNGVFGFWQCRDGYDSFANIGVINYLSRKEEVEVQESIGSAEAKFQELSIVLPPTRGDC